MMGKRSGWLRAADYLTVVDVVAAAVQPRVHPAYSVLPRFYFMWFPEFPAFQATDLLATIPAFW